MSKYSFLVFIILMGAWSGCKKSDSLIVPQEQAHFTNKVSGSYFVTGPNAAFKIPVGFTTVSDKDRTVTISVTSPTGAVAGTHYNVNTSLVIPAGKALDSLVVQGVYAQYLGGRKDTLIFTITDQTAKSSDYNNTFTLFMRGPCFEGDVDLDVLKGEYRNTNEVWNGGPYGPYTTTITAVNKTGPTTGTITVANIFDAGWNPITFNLDWTDPNNRKVTVSQQSGIGNAGTITSAYAGMDISVRPDRTGVIGTFSVCNQTLTLRFELGVTGLGFFNIRYTVNMAR